MANDVFANGREISCKSGSGKTICCFPDVCFTPPENPATPPGVPVPYPNTGMASDTTSGSNRVKISAKEIMLKNKSYFKKSMGDEAGCAAKKGIVTSVNRGKVYFIAWSMDVKAEGENVVRHLDMTTHNHASPITNTPPWPYADSQAVADDPCAKDKAKEQEACKGFQPEGSRDACDVAGLGSTSRPRTHSAASALIERRQQSDANECISARRCRLQPYKKTKKGEGGCCPSQTGNHVIPSSYFKSVGSPPYNADNAPTMCVDGTSWHSGNHGYLHTAQSILDGFYADSRGTVSVEQAAANGAQAQKEIFQGHSCDQKCIRAQVIKGHEDMGLDKKTRVEHQQLAEGDTYVERLESVLEGDTIP
jgi:hypothetical protein